MMKMKWTLTLTNGAESRQLEVDGHLLWPEIEKQFPGLQITLDLGKATMDYETAMAQAKAQARDLLEALRAAE